MNGVTGGYYRICMYVNGALQEQVAMVAPTTIPYLFGTLSDVGCFNTGDRIQITIQSDSVTGFTATNPSEIPTFSIYQLY